MCGERATLCVREYTSCYEETSVMFKIGILVIAGLAHFYFLLTRDIRYRVRVYTCWGCATIPCDNFIDNYA